MSATASYDAKRGELETYFDRTAVEAWKRLTSDAPVSGIRATVRAGRDAMRATLLGFLPEDLTGRRILDAGCGTGALAVEAARRGADVVAIDISPTLVSLAGERAPTDLKGSVEFKVGDMMDATLGHFDHVVAMDSLIHYRAADIVRVLAALADRTRHSMVFTIAPRTPLLTAMHTVGRVFPRGDRAPAIEPVSDATFAALLGAESRLSAFPPRRGARISCGFYISQAWELARA